MITPELAYVAGFIIGDGNLSDKYLVRAVEKNEKFIREIFSNKFYASFGVLPKTYFDRYNNSYVAYVHSKRIWSALNELNIPKGNKSRTVRIPEQIRLSNVPIKSAFLSAIFDAEGSVIIMKDSHHPNGYIRIQLKVHNVKLAKDIFDMLSDFGLRPRIYFYGYFAVLQLNGKKQCKLFLEKVGFKHPLKNEKMSIFLAKNTEQGVYLCGEDNSFNEASIAKAKSA